MPIPPKGVETHEVVRKSNCRGPNFGQFRALALTDLYGIAEFRRFFTNLGGFGLFFTKLRRNRPIFGRFLRELGGYDEFRRTHNV